MRGALRTSRMRGGMRWTRRLRLTSAADADGEVVWSWRPDAGAKFFEKQTLLRGDGGKNAGHRGEHAISRKPLRREGRMPPLNLYARVRFFAQLCTRDRGCQPAPGFPCALCLSEGERETQSSGAIAPRQCGRTSSRCMTIESEIHTHVVPGKPKAQPIALYSSWRSPDGAERNPGW